MNTMTRLLCLMLLLSVAAATADTRADRLARLKSDLLGGASATETLTRWCGELHFADPPQIHAEAARTSGAEASVRALLKVNANELVHHRHVRLTCGGRVLSEADNWYLPERLTLAMNRVLDETDTPFGGVVRPLNFHRRTLAAAPARGAVLQVRALLLTPDEKPFSLVVENYTTALLGP
jgi:hypothetical protein